MSNHGGWLMKMEFGPDWLESQGTQPLEFLNHLVDHFAVVECPARFRFKGDGIDRLFAEPLASEETGRFLSHVVSLDDRDMGWCDLLIRPR